VKRDTKRVESSGLWGNLKTSRLKEKEKEKKMNKMGKYVPKEQEVLLTKGNPNRFSASNFKGTSGHF